MFSRVWEDTLHFYRKNPKETLLTGFGILYLSYYLLYAVKKPIFACRDAKFRRFLHSYVPVVNEKFWPTLWCFEARIMTIVRAVIQSVPDITYTSDILTLPDGGQVILHWEENENSIYSDSKTRPTVLLLPGLTGCSRQSYILHLVKQAKDKGYRCVVFNNRGAGGKKLLTPRSYCAANVEDLTNVINHIKGKYPDAPLIATGISMGGMLVFNYIAKMGRDCPLLAGMTISVAFNVFESTKSLEQPLNHLLFNRTLTSSLRGAIKENFQVLSEKFDLEHVLKSSTIREFDDRLTSKMFGYKDWQEYYKDATLHDKCHHIQVPLLCLNAADDPFSPLYAIPIEDAKQNDHLAIVVTSHGGHIGFLEGFFPRYQNYMDRFFAQYVDAMFKHANEELVNNAD